MHEQVSHTTAQAQKLAAALQTSIGATLSSTIAKTGPVTASGVQTFVKAITAPSGVPPAASAAAVSPPGAGSPVQETRGCNANLLMFKSMLLTQRPPTAVVIPVGRRMVYGGASYPG